MSVSDLHSEGVHLVFEVIDVPKSLFVPVPEVGVVDGFFFREVSILVVKVLVLFFEDSELILVFSEEVDLFFEVGDDDFLLVGFYFEGRVKVRGSGFRGTHVFVNWE